MNDIERAWAAGFYDGEGSFTICRLKSGRIYPQICLAQVDRRPLERFLSAVGGGGVFGPYEHKRKNENSHWVYRCKKIRDLAEVVEAILPHLSEPKREQMLCVLEKCLASFDENPARVPVSAPGGRFILGASQIRPEPPWGEIRLRELYAHVRRIDCDLATFKADLAAI